MGEAVVPKLGIPDLRGLLFLLLLLLAILRELNLVSGAPPPEDDDEPLRATEVGDEDAETEDKS